jgi:S1-C subfamily serine protease
MKTHAHSEAGCWEHLGLRCSHTAPFCRAAVSLTAVAFLLTFSFQAGCSRNRSPIAKSQTLSPVELFQKISPSVFVVETLDRNGKTLALGSAVAVSNNLLITNCHVVEEGSFLRVRHGSNKWSAALVEALPNHDVCGLGTNSREPQRWDPVAEFHKRWANAKLSDDQILTNLRDPMKFRSAFPNYDGLTDDQIREHVAKRVKPSGPTLSPVQIIPSSDVATGERVYAIGAPEGLELTFSEGVVSSLREAEGVHMIQTSAPTSPGSSGGGLFDAQANLIGITTFQLREGQSLNFALPGEWVKSALDSLAEASHKSSSRLTDTQLESTAWLRIGQDAVKSENYDLAVDSLQKSADLREGDSSESWLELGNLWGRVSNIWESSSAYQHWLCSRASREGACVYGTPNKSTIRESEDRAIAAFEHSIELRPDYAEVWLQLARAHASREQYDQAVSSAKEATRLGPSDWKAWIVLAGSCISAEDYDGAIDAAQKGAKVAPADMQIAMLSVMGEAYAKKGDRAEVICIYQQIKSSNASYAEYFFKEYALPRQNEHPSTQRSKKDSDALRILRSASTTDDVRQAAWDAFHTATNEGDFMRRLNALSLPDKIKRELWELKFGSQVPTGNPPPK